MFGVPGIRASTHFAHTHVALAQDTICTPRAMFRFHTAAPILQGVRTDQSQGYDTQRHGFQRIGNGGHARLLFSNADAMEARPAVPVTYMVRL